MKLITINGKQYELKFTYKSIMLIEAAWNEPYYKVLQGNRFENLYKMLWACLRNHEDFATITPFDCVDMIDKLVEESSLFDLAELIETAVYESNLVRELLAMSTPFEEEKEK
jgi:hypothetical protein